LKVLHIRFEAGEVSSAAFILQGEAGKQPARRSICFDGAI
jgi:hypothetical protein